MSTNDSTLNNNTNNDNINSIRSIEDSPLVKSIQERIFGPETQAQEYRQYGDEYLENGGDPDEF